MAETDTLERVTATRVQVARVGPPDGRLVLFAGGLREHFEEEHR